MPNTISAYQHIYANVEKAQSPQGRGGFQTLFYSHAGLGEAEVEEMESRLLYFPSDIEPVKRLFFTLSGGQAVVSQIVGLPDPDQVGRKGRYLAHSLVFSPEALAVFEADPFRVFRYFMFITTVADALAQGDFQTGDLPPAALKLPPEPKREIEAAREWPAAELQKLALLALRAGRLAGERELVTFSGQPAQVEQALAAAFVAVPAARRPDCTFDTYFYHCNPVATYFWGIGLPEPPASVKFALVAAADRQVQSSVPLQPETAYERWAGSVIEAQYLNELIRSRDCALALGEWLDERTYNLAALEAASPELVAAVLQANPGPVRALLGRRLSQHLPSVLAERAAGYLFNRSAGAALYPYLRQGFELASLGELLWASYAVEEFRRPSGAELKALAGLLEQADYPALRLCLAYWQDPRKALPRALQLAGEADYSVFAGQALRYNLVKPAALIVPGKGASFLSLPGAATPANLVELAQAFITIKEPAPLARLAPLVPHLSGKELKSLAHLIDREPGVPEPFRLAVERALAELPPEGGLKGLLKKIWNR